MEVVLIVEGVMVGERSRLARRAKGTVLLDMGRRMLVVEEARR